VEIQRTMATMLRLAWLDVKGCIRRPIWIVLAVLSVLLFYSASVPDFEPSITNALTGLPHTSLVSLGEWGRLALLFGGSVVGGLFALFVSLMIVEAFHAELSHRDVLWATPGAGGLATTVPRVLAITTLATVIIYTGSAAALVNPENRQILVEAGGGYVPIYFALMWLQVLVWSSLSLFVLYLTRSRWIAPVVVTILSGLWFVAGMIGYPSSFVGLLHRSYLAWNFISPFAPLGLVPEMMALQAASYAGLGFLLICGSLMIRRQFPEWRHVRQPLIRIAAALATLCVVGTSIGGAGVLRSHTASFSLDEPQFDTTAGRLIEQTYADRPYIWSGNGVLLFYPGTYGAVRLFPGEEPPSWLSEIADGREIRLYEEAGTITYTRQGAVYGRRRQSLVLLLPLGDSVPAELEASLACIREELMPMLNRASIWHGGTELYIAPPGTGIEQAEAVTDGVVISSNDVLRSINLDSVAWTLAELTSLEKPEKLYLYLYLAELFDARTERYLDQLRSAASGNVELPPPTVVNWTPPIPRWDASWDGSMAARIVDHWERGERLGHSDYIRSLLKEVSDDSA